MMITQPYLSTDMIPLKATNVRS